MDKHFAEALTLLVLVVATPVVAAALEPAATPTPSASPPPHPAPVAHGVYKFIDLIIPVESVPGLIGAKTGSLIASYCIDGVEHIAPVKLLPRRIVGTFLVSANTTVLMPELGEDRILPSDVIVVSLPIPTPGTGLVEPVQHTLAARVHPCSWSSYAAKTGIGHRVVISLTKYTRVVEEKGVTILGQPVSFAVYFDYNHSPFQGEFPVLGLKELERLGKLLGLKTPPIQGPDLGRLEVEWNSFLEQLRSRLVQFLPPSSIAVGPLEHASYQPPAGATPPRYVGGQSSRDSRVHSNNSGPAKAPLAFTGGGGTTSEYYHFLLIVANKTKVPLTGRKVSIYMGYGVDKVVLYLRANSTSTVSAGLQVTVKIIDVSSRTNPVVLQSYTYTYQLGSTPRDIYIYPVVQWRDKPLNITIEFRHAYGANPYIIIAALNFYKIWSSMPIEQTRQAVQVLSAGIAKIRDPYNPDWLPPGCQQARASDMLRPTSYSPPLGYGGLVAPSSLRSVTIDASMMNGLYYDGATSPVLYLDICIHSRSQAAGTITVKVNGVTYASKTITVSPPYSYAGFTISLGPQPQKGHGPVITIEHNLPEGMELYVDAVVKYQYAPEVWREDSLYTWYSLRSPWFKLLLYEYRGTYVGWESSIVVDARILSNVDYQVVVLKHRVSMEEGSLAGVKSAGITVKPPIPTVLVSCSVRHGEGNKLEEYVGAAATTWGLITTGLEVFSLLGMAIPEPVSKGAVIAGLAITVLKSASEQKTVTMSNGYYMCAWSSGLDTHEWVEVTLQVILTTASPSLSNPFRVSAMANDVWELNDQAFTIPYYDRSIIKNTLDEGYRSFYGRPPHEVIYS